MASSIRVAVKSVAAILAAISLNWLVSNVDTHSDHVQLGLQSHLESAQHPRPRFPPLETTEIDAAGPDVIHMYECMCAGPVGGDIRGWVGLWIVTAVIGGLPTAVVVRATYAKTDFPA